MGLPAQHSGLGHFVATVGGEEAGLVAAVGGSRLVVWVTVDLDHFFVPVSQELSVGCGACHGNRGLLLRARKSDS